MVMRRRVFLWPALVGILVATADAQVPDALTRARQAYNSRQFDAAITAAKEALQIPASANAAAVVLARAYLERSRIGSDGADLEAARAALAQVRPGLLNQADRSEFFVGMGLALYEEACIDGCYTAAAEFFDLALAVVGDSDPVPRESVFDWWASALDRQAVYGADEERVSIYKRILERAETERTRHPDGIASAYWIAAGARGAGDLNRAWGAAIAGWMRGKYLGPRGESLRTDLNELVTTVLLPERARQQVPDGDPRPVLETMKKQWAEIAEKYK